MRHIVPRVVLCFVAYLIMYGMIALLCSVVDSSVVWVLLDDCM